MMKAGGDLMCNRLLGGIKGARGGKEWNFSSHTPKCRPLNHQVRVGRLVSAVWFEGDIEGGLSLLYKKR